MAPPTTSRRFHPVFVSHSREVGDLLTLTRSLDDYLIRTGQNGTPQHKCIRQLRRDCQTLLLRMEAEDGDILLLEDPDYELVRKIVNWVKVNLYKEKSVG